MNSYSYDEPIRCRRCGGDLDEYATHDDFGPVCDTCSKQPDETATSPEDRAFEAWVQEEPSRADTLFGRAYTQDGARVAVWPERCVWNARQHHVQNGRQTCQAITPSSHLLSCWLDCCVTWYISLSMSGVSCHDNRHRQEGVRLESWKRPTPTIMEATSKT